MLVGGSNVAVATLLAPRNTERVARAVRARSWPWVGPICSDKAPGRRPTGGNQRVTPPASIRDLPSQSWNSLCLDLAGSIAQLGVDQIQVLKIPGAGGP